MTACRKEYIILTAACINLILIFTGCTLNKDVDILSDGIIVHIKQPPPNGAALIRLSVISSRIIQVAACAAGKKLSGESSLMRDSASLPAAAWAHESTQTSETIKTPSISATISKLTGEVVFRDSTGNIILQEKKGGGKKLIPVTIDNKSLYGISQVFESPTEEAFYGLGQPQTGIFNYKNTLHNIILW